MFVRDPLDIAPGAKRFKPAARLRLLLGLVFLLSSGFMLFGPWAEKKVDEATGQQGGQPTLQAADQAAKFKRPDDPAALVSHQAQQTLQHHLRMSWTGLFDALETASRQVDGGVSVLALAPTHADASSAEVALTAHAVSEQLMLDYVRALEASSAVRAVQLVAHESGTNPHKQIVRFRLSILWEQWKQETAPQPSQTDGFVQRLPLYVTHPDDVRSLLSLANQHGASIGSVSYRSKPATPLIVVRELEVRLDESYSTLKSFLAGLLDRMPHLFLREIRMERVNSAASKLQVALTLSIAYRNSGPAPQQLQMLERLNDSAVHNPFADLNPNAMAGSQRQGGSDVAVQTPIRRRVQATKAEPPALPPAPAVAPALPFAAIGSITGAEVADGEPVAFIKHHDRLLVVRAGDAVTASYRIESISAHKIEIMYLPLMQRQSLALAQ